ncbi:hypothetical protein AB0C96_37670 [Streptomyces sp. NPDC048506]|uniref:hypothetical protein n=1 Tax=Streptomyces sp. NPDC048506 TaxID=3155028 RepID=UPI00343D1FF7
MENDDEPVFKRSTWGTNRYVYNPNNPVGLALIVISLIFAVMMMVLMQKHAGPFAPPPDPTPWSPPPLDDEPWPTPAPGGTPRVGDTPSPAQQTGP